MMKRSAVTLFAASLLLLPTLSAMAHTDRELGRSLESQEITVTGHDERDATLHIEAAAGIVLVDCPECVLEKRQSGTDEQAQPKLEFDPSKDRAGLERPASRSCELSSSSSPRAPPLS